MARIILSVLFLVALVVLIVLNAGASAPVNVFGWQVESLSITVVGLVCFVAGVLYSFIFYLMAFFERGRRERLAKRKTKLKNQEADLKNREAVADEKEEESRRRLETARSLEAPVRERQGPMARLFGPRGGKKAGGATGVKDTTEDG